MEMTIADLNHQLQRNQRARGQAGGRAVEATASALGGGGGTPGAYLLGAATGGGAAASPQTFTVSSGASVHGTRAMDELAGRLAEAERERDSIEAQRRQIALQLRSINEQFVAERTNAAARAEQVQRQQRRLEDEVASIRQERAKLIGQVADLEEQTVRQLDP